MRATEFIAEDELPKKNESHIELEDFDLDENGKTSRELCKSSKPDSALGASALSSCVSQGLRSRKAHKKKTIGGKRISIYGKKIKGRKYGGPIKDD